jgi:Holliday junction resolvase RusA-like endonuclease
MNNIISGGEVYYRQIRLSQVYPGTFLEKYKNYVHKILKMHSQKLASNTGIKVLVCFS